MDSRVQFRRLLEARVTMMEVSHISLIFPALQLDQDLSLFDSAIEESITTDVQTPW